MVNLAGYVKESIAYDITHNQEEYGIDVSVVLGTVLASYLSLSIPPDTALLLAEESLRQVEEDLIPGLEDILSRCVNGKVELNGAKLCGTVLLTMYATEKEDQFKELERYACELMGVVPEQE